jgi:hypothetical protein
MANEWEQCRVRARPFLDAVALKEARCTTNKQYENCDGELLLEGSMGVTYHIFAARSTWGRNSQTSPHNTHTRHPSHSIPSWTKSKFIVCIDLWIHRDSMPSCPNVNPSAPYAPYGEPMRMHSYKHKAHSTSTNLPPSATHARKERVVYFSFFLAAPLTFAVPRRVFCLFLRCLPSSNHISIIPNLTIPKCDSQRTLLSAGLLNLRRESYSDQTVMWLELLQGFWRVVDERETGCLSTTILCLKTENVDLILVGLVHFGELASKLILGDVGTVGVEDITIGTR